MISPRLDTILAAVEAAERAWAEARLGPLMRDEDVLREAAPALRECYERLAAQGVARAMPFRLRFAGEILGDLRQELAAPSATYPASASWRTPDEGTAEPDASAEPPAPRLERLIARDRDREVPIRLDQLLPLRRWGIGLALDDARACEVIEQYVERAIVHRLVSDISGLEKLERALGDRLPAGTNLIADSVGRRFEALMLDVLNELEPVARRAPLFEDILEKTDLRVRYPGMRRKRGARVQVTRIARHERHAMKLQGIRLLEEYVILSPLSLAEALLSSECRQIFDLQDVGALWSSIRLSSRADGLAESLLLCFEGALTRAHQDPRGPAAFVPEALRRLVRAFVLHKAQESTLKLREREQREREMTEDSS